MKDHVFVAVGPNCWGRGETRELALSRAKKEFPSWTGEKPLNKYFTVRCVHKSAEVSPVDGAIMWNAKHDARNCPHCEVGKRALAPA